MHHQFGTPITQDPIKTDQAFIDAGDVVLVDEHTVLAIATIRADQTLPALALSLSGRLNKTDDTLQATYLMSPVDFGVLVGQIMAQVNHHGGTMRQDFHVGMRQGLEGKSV